MQSALHLVSQSAVVGTATHWVLQFSSQQAPHDAWQSADDEAETLPPSEDDEELEVHEELQPDWQRVLQSVVQSNVGGLSAQDVEQEEEQSDVQVASAVAVHCPSHCSSSFAAQACSQVGGAHWVVQSDWVASEHWALASMSMSPQALRTSARAVPSSERKAAQVMAGAMMRAQ